MKEVQEKLLPGELGVSPRIYLLIFPPRVGDKRGLTEGHDNAHILTDHPLYHSCWKMRRVCNAQRRELTLPSPTQYTGNRSI